MKKNLIILSVLSLFLSGCTIPFIGNRQSALQINTDPQTSVYLQGKHVGQTPYYDTKLKPGEYNLRLLVDNDSSKDWQTTVTLSPGLVTVLQKAFGPTPEESSHSFLQLEPLANKKAIQLSLITTPDNAIVKLDGQPQGFTPLAMDNISAGDHTLTLSAPGYKEFSLKATAKEGYKLVITAQMARTPILPTEDAPATPSAQLNTNPTPAPSPSIKPRTTPAPATSPNSTSSAEPARPFVEILDTPTGFLRVRSEPTTSGENEVAQLKPGQKVPWIEVNDSGWYKVEYTAGKQGWISAKYAKLYK